MTAKQGDVYKPVIASCYWAGEHGRHGRVIRRRRDEVFAAAGWTGSRPAID